MINHVVLFKLKEFPDAEKKVALEKVKTALEALKDKIKELKYLEIGLNYQLNGKSYDICLISHFETVADLDIYRVHPDHLAVFDLIKEVTIDRAAVDFMF